MIVPASSIIEDLASDILRVGKRLHFEVMELPRVDRYFPNCWATIIESVSKFMFKTDDFGRIYGFHTFQYSNSLREIAFKENEIELDLEFGRSELAPGILRSNILRYFGITVCDRSFSDFESFWGYCQRNLENKTPVIFDFCLGHIRSRREYGKIFSRHVMALTGIQWVGGNPVLVAIEQMLGVVTIDPHDFYAGVCQNIQQAGSVFAYELTREEDFVRPVEACDAWLQTKSNLANLRSMVPGTGLGGVEEFITDLSEFLGGSHAANPKPFNIPGLWALSHERHILRKWFRCQISDHGSLLVGPITEGFDPLLASLFRRWLNVDFLLEKALETGHCKGLVTLPSYLKSILDEEKRVADQWEKFGELLVSIQS